MKNKWLVLSALVLSAGLSSCISASETVFTKPGAIDKKASYKVTAVNTEDIVLGKLETYLLEQGFKLILDNEIRTRQVSDYVTVSTLDTTFQNPRYQWVKLELFDAKPSDFVVRFQYVERPSLTRLVFSDFNASVIDIQTGMPVATYSFRQSRTGIGKKRAEKVLRDFAKRLAE